MSDSHEHTHEEESLTKVLLDVEAAALSTDLKLEKPEGVELSLEQLKHYRRQEMIKTIREELQVTLKYVDECQTKIKAAKTGYKKTYYNKKIKKASDKVKQMLSFLQQLEALDQPTDNQETPQDENLPTGNPVVEPTANVVA